MLPSFSFCPLYPLEQISASILACPSSLGHDEFLLWVLIFVAYLFCLLCSLYAGYELMSAYFGILNCDDHLYLWADFWGLNWWAQCAVVISHHDELIHMLVAGIYIASFSLILSIVPAALSWTGYMFAARKTVAFDCLLKSNLSVSYACSPSRLFVNRV